MKDLKISNILLTEILKSPVEIISIDEYKCMIRNSTYFDNEQKGTVYRYLYGNEEIRFMSIYEFAFKCKEWAFLQGYELRSGRDIDVKEDLCYFCEYKQERQLDYYDGDYFLAKSEPEAIIKACNWILERSNEKI